MNGKPSLLSNNLYTNILSMIFISNSKKVHAFLDIPALVVVQVDKSFDGNFQTDDYYSMCKVHL